MATHKRHPGCLGVGCPNCPGWLQDRDYFKQRRGGINPLTGFYEPYIGLLKNKQLIYKRSIAEPLGLEWLDERDTKPIRFSDLRTVAPTAFGSGSGPRGERAMSKNPEGSCRQTEAWVEQSLRAEAQANPEWAGVLIVNVAKEKKQKGYDHEVQKPDGSLLIVVNSASGKATTEPAYQKALELQNKGIRYYLAGRWGRMEITKETPWRIASRRF